MAIEDDRRPLAPEGRGRHDLPGAAHPTGMARPEMRGAARHANPPAFNVPGVVLIAILAFGAIQVWRSFGLSPQADARLLLDLAFIPACYGEDCTASLGRQEGARYWSPLSHAFLHGDWTHLGLNTVWLLAFGTPVARRLGTLAFLVFAGLGAVAGALLFYVLNPDLLVPVIGASGIVAALMGGACRFAFSTIQRPGDPAARLPRLSIPEALSNRTVVFFILVFFATNLLTASGLGGFLDGGAAVAWEAHLGGFAFGFLGFGLFDRFRPAKGRAF